jgi:hypothetical protein
VFPSANEVRDRGWNLADQVEIVIASVPCHANQIVRLDPRA